MLLNIIIFFALNDGVSVARMQLQASSRLRKKTLLAIAL